MSKKKDLTGMVFGKLTVVKELYVQGSEWYWLCKCECGNEKKCRGSHLTHGDQVSCRMCNSIVFNDIVFSQDGHGYYKNRKVGQLHVYVYEQHYKCSILSGYVVHHKDGNKANNDPTNLELMSRSEHLRLHNTGKMRTKEHSENIAIKLRGKKHTEEHKRKIGESSKQAWILRKMGG